MPSNAQPQLSDSDLFAAMSASIEAAERAAPPRLERFPPLEAPAFYAASLSRWIELAQAAGVPHIPATVVGTLNVDHILQFDFEEADTTPEQVATFDELSRINDEIGPGHMLRWDCCAPHGIKYRMHAPEPEKAGDRPEDIECMLTPDDSRAYDILYTYPAESVPVLRRPWIKAQVIAGYPVEFRVMVANGSVAAVSSYYIQRALPQSPLVMFGVAECMRLARKLIAEMTKQGLVPRMSAQDESSSYTCTLDFSVVTNSSGEPAVLFVEGGPGSPGYAHPCCFYNEETGEVDQITGLRLAQGGPTLPLPDANPPP